MTVRTLRRDLIRLAATLPAGTDRKSLLQLVAKGKSPRELLRELEEHLKTLERYPTHAGAVEEGLKTSKALLGALVEGGIKDPKLSKHVYSTNVWVNNVSNKPRSNQFYADTGKSLVSNLPVMARLVERAEQENSVGPETRTIGPVTLTDGTGTEQQIDTYVPVVKTALSAMKRAGISKAAEGADLVLVSPSNLPAQGHGAAVYTSRGDRIYIAAPSPDFRDLTERLLHEFGHRYHARYMKSDPDDWRRTWIAAKDSGVPFVTPYAGTHWREDHAECFALFALGKLREPHLTRFRTYGL